MITITQKLPDSQKDIILDALLRMEKFEKENYDGSDKGAHLLFDILTLRKLIQYDVTVSMTESQHQHFTGVNGVDYPEYI